MAEARMFYEKDCNLSLLDGKTIAVIGYGRVTLTLLTQRSRAAMLSSAFMRAVNHGLRQSSRALRFIPLPRLQKKPTLL